MSKWLSGGILIIAFVALATAASGALRSSPTWSKLVSYALFAVFLLIARRLGLFIKSRG